MDTYMYMRILKKGHNSGTPCSGLTKPSW